LKAHNNINSRLSLPEIYCLGLLSILPFNTTEWSDTAVASGSGSGRLRPAEAKVMVIL